MSNQHPEPIHHKGEGVKLVGNPEELINLLITRINERKWATDQIINEGPKHKQVLSALLLNRLYILVQAIEKSSNSAFVLQKGYEIIKEKGEEKIILPIAVPINVAPGMDKKKIAEVISHAPEHEALVYAICIQVIEWAIKATAKNN